MKYEEKILFATSIVIIIQFDALFVETFSRRILIANIFASFIKYFINIRTNVTLLKLLIFYNGNQKTMFKL